jgi:hypothetical protein
MLGATGCFAPREVLEDDMGKTVLEKQTQVLFGIEGLTHLTGQEGHGRYSFEDKRRFLDISLGSCKEVQSHLYVALDQVYLRQSEFDEAYRQAEAVAQLITGTLENLDRQIASRPSSKSRARRKDR